MDNCYECICHFVAKEKFGDVHCCTASETDDDAAYYWNFDDEIAAEHKIKHPENCQCFVKKQQGETCKNCANLECSRWGQNRPACRNYQELINEGEEAYKEHLDIF